MKRSWELVADNLSKAGFSWGCVSAIDSNRRTIWIADVHRCDGQRFVVYADEALTTFLELESAIRGCGRIGLTTETRPAQHPKIESFDRPIASA